MSPEIDSESGSQIIRDLAIRKRGHIDSCESQAMDAIKQSKEEISFSGKSKDYCVSIVDIVNSTRIVSEIVDADQVRKYYTIFQNTVSNIIEKHGAKTFKTLGDSLIYYFPMTEDSTNKIAFQRVMECSMDVLEACSPMNVELQREQLPSIGYRLSADYGRLEVARCSTSESDDLFGSTINICSKINREGNPKWYGNRWRFIHSIEIPRLYRKFPHACNRRICWRFKQIFLPNILCHTTANKKYLRFKGDAIRGLLHKKWQSNKNKFQIIYGTEAV